MESAGGEDLAAIDGRDVTTKHQLGVERSGLAVVDGQVACHSGPTTQ